MRKTLNGVIIAIVAAAGGAMLASWATPLSGQAPAAYRDVSDVLEDQEDLVTRVVRLEPIAVLKG